MGVDAELSGIPVVDFAEWESSTTEKKSRIAAELVDACKAVGFVYIVNHKIAPERLAEAFEWSKKLFALSHEEKMLAPHPDGFAVHRGYSWPGLEKVSNAVGDEDDPEIVAKLRQVSDVKESYEVGSEENQSQPNQWIPEVVLPGFRDFMNDFYWESHENAKMLLRAMAIGLGLSDEDYFLATHSGHNNQLRLLHYPSVPAADFESKTMTRMPAHCDWPTLTMLFQDDCGGLEIENPHKQGEFIPAPPLKDAIVMNVGDLLQRWSNDSLKSTMHRVGLPPRQDRFTGDERTTQARYSIPYFVSPEGPTVVACLPSCANADNPVKHKPIKWNDYMLMRASMQYEERPASVAVSG